MMILSISGITHYFILHSWWSSVIQTWPITVLFIYDDPQSPSCGTLRYSSFMMLLGNQGFYSSFMMIVSNPGMTLEFTLHSWWTSVNQVWPITLLFVHDDPQYPRFVGAQWLSGRVLDSRPRGRGFEPHWRLYVVSLSKNINPSLVLVQPRKTRPFITERLLIGRKESNQTNETNKIPGVTHYVTLHPWWSSVTQMWPITLLFIHDFPQ